MAQPPLKQRASSSMLRSRDSGVFTSRPASSLSVASGTSTSHSGTGATSSYANGSDGGSGGANATSVQVAVRIRPITAHDQSSIPTRWQRNVVQPVGTSAILVDASGQAPPGQAPVAGAAKKHTFTFDRVHGADNDQEAIYTQTVQPMISRYLEGYNATVLAYGQTSSGKSYTMGTSLADTDLEGLAAGQAPQEDAGIIPRAISQIFTDMKQVQARSGNSVQFQFKLSFIEIYNEELIDLLATEEGDSRPLVQIREDKAGHIFWAGLREVRVKNVSDVMSNLLQGSAVRRTHETDMNAQSSRSHAIFSLTLTQRKPIASRLPSSPGPPPTSMNHRASMMGSSGRQTPTGRTTPTGRGSALPRPTSSLYGSNPRASMIGRPNTPGRASSALGHHGDDADGGEWVTITSKFHFVDLAGSERLKRTAALGERAREGISINAGLHALGNVISALGDPAKSRRTTHIPYRDSKLTRLLQDSLGGNAITSMIACVAPTEYNVSETVNTLQYANRARNIKNKAELNQVEIGWDDVEYLQMQVLRLRKELQLLRGFKAGTPGIDAAMQVMEQKDVLEWQSRYAALSQKFTALTAEVTQLQRSSSHDSGSNDDYLKAAEPIIIEYEKTVDALEGQINLMKAALGHSEDVIFAQEQSVYESESRIVSLEEDLRAREKNMNALQERLTKLEQREKTANVYASSLEAQLASRSSTTDAEEQDVNQIRKELAKLRDTETSRELYIKDVEARLADSSESMANLKAKLVDAEQDIARREQAFAELQERTKMLDNSVDSKAMLAELDERGNKLLDLQAQVESLQRENESVTRERGKLADTLAEHQIERGKLEDQIRNLKAAAPAAAPANLTNTSSNMVHSASTQSSRISTSSRSTAPIGSQHEEDVSFFQTQVEMLTEELKGKDDAARHAQAELSTLNERYTQAMTEVQDLQRQLSALKAHDAKLRQFDRPLLLRTASQHSFDSPLRKSRPESLLHDNTLAYRRSASRRNSGSFLGYNPRESTPRDGTLLQQQTPHSAIPMLEGESMRNQSASSSPLQHSNSVSQRWGSRSAGHRPLSLSGSADFAKLGLDTSSAGLVLDNLRRHGIGGRDGSRDEAESPLELSRKVASLEAETMRLQEILAKRDEEIALLESQKGDKTPEALTPGASTPAPVATNVVPNENIERDPTESSPSTPSHDRSDDHDLDELMRAMARKESEAQRQLEALQQALDDERKEREAAASIALNQQQQLMAEIESLRGQQSDQANEADKNVQDKDLDIDSKRLSKEASAVPNGLHPVELKEGKGAPDLAQELETPTAAEHDEAQEQHKLALSALTEKHHLQLQEMSRTHARALDELNQKLAAKEAEGALEKGTLTTDAATELQDQEAKQAEALLKLSKEHEAALASVKEEHARVLSTTKDETNIAISQLKSDLMEAKDKYAKTVSAHSAELATHQRDYETLQHTHVHALEQLEALKSAHNEELRSTTKSHQTQLNDISKDLQDARASCDAIAAAHDDLRAKYDGLLEQDPNDVVALRAELNETSDALVTLEGALTEMQGQRDEAYQNLEELRNGSEVSSLRQSVAQAQKNVELLQSSLANTRSELQRVKSDLRGMMEEKTRQDSMMRELEIKLTIAETRSASSMRSQGNTPVLSENGFSHESANHTLRNPAIPRRNSDLDKPMRTTSGSSKPPPLSPPPNMPPPPTPVNGSTTPTQLRSPYNSRMSGSSTSLVHSRAESPSSRPAMSRSPSAASMSANSAQFISASHESARTKLISEQAEEIKNLAKQLNHCEQDLQANIDLVATLEAALNDSERNLRKSRVQLSEAARERDRYASQIDELKQEVHQAQREADNVRSSVLLEKQGFESQLQQEREAKERARRALESRLEEVHKKKNSRLFCL